MHNIHQPFDNQERFETELLRWPAASPRLNRKKWQIFGRLKGWSGMSEIEAAKLWLTQPFIGNRVFIRLKSAIIGVCQGVTGATGFLGGDPSSSTAAAQLGKLLVLRYSRSRDAEFEADRWAVLVANASGYDPTQMIGVLEILKQLGGGKAPPEFLSTHPSSESRIESIRNVIASEIDIGQVGMDGGPRQVLQHFN